MKQARQIIANAFNAHPTDRDAFETRVRKDFKTYGMSPAVIIAAIRLAIALYKFWSAANLTAAPSSAMDGEPEFS